MSRASGTLLVLVPLITGVVAATVLAAPVPGLLGVIVAALLAWRVAGGGRAGWRALGFRAPARVRRTIAIGIAAMVAVHVVLGLALPLLSRVLGAPDLSAFARLQGRLDLLVLMLVIAVVNGAFAEEIVFRGFLQGQVEAALGRREHAPLLALALVSVVFGLGHAYQGPTGMIGTALAGGIFGAAMLADRRVLWSAVLAHGLYDWSGMVLLYLRGVG